MGRKPKKGKKNKTPSAPRDKHLLYEMSVQSPEADVEFVDKAFKHRYGEKAQTLREDFCGTAVFAAQWVKHRKENRAWGIDLDEPTLAWGREHHLDKLSPDEQERIALMHGDVLDGMPSKVDVISAQNFSYMIFKERPLLERYFKKVREGLKDKGAFVMDIYGGVEAMQPAEEATEYEDEGFTYVWDQKSFNPINHHTQCAIHFKFPEGKKMKNAFEYDWRLWTIPELSEALHNVGFKEVVAFWEGADKDGDGDGNFKPRTSVEQEDAWIAYVVGYTS